jgi:hypothetical protein
MISKYGKPPNENYSLISISKEAQAKNHTLELSLYLLSVHEEQQLNSANFV